MAMPGFREDDMKNLFLGACAVVLALSMLPLFGQGVPLTASRWTPDEIIWGVSPSGTRLARIAGDPSKPGLYATRLRFAADTKVQPHVHTDERIVTVISGTLHVGFAEKFDESQLKALPAGSVWIEPANQPHFSWARDGEVIIQVVGYGPSVSKPVQPRE